MSERGRLERDIGNLESLRRGLEDNISDYRGQLARAQRDRADAGNHHDAYLRQRAAEARIRDLESSISSSRREIGRYDNQIRGLQSEIRSLR